jgi:hypothetical protein
MAKLDEKSVTDAGFGERFVKTALDTWGVPDSIVNNAGYTWDNVIQKMSESPVTIRKTRCRHRP